MSFAEGFSSGVQLGDSIKRRKLDREMLALRKQQAADDLELQKQLAAQRAQQVAEDVALRRDDLTLRRDDLGFRRENAAADNARADAQLSANRMNAITGQLGSALAQDRQNRLVDAQVSAMRAKASGVAGGKAGGAYRTVRREDPETGEVTTERYPIAGPTATTTQPQRPTLNATAAAAQGEIDKLVEGNTKDRIAMAKGEDPYWFTNPSAEIAKRNKTIGQLQNLLPTDTAAAETQQPINWAPTGSMQYSKTPQGGGAAPTPAQAGVMTSSQLAGATSWAQANPNDPRAAEILKRAQALSAR